MGRFALSAFGTWFAHVVGRRLTGLHYVQQKAEADFRFSLMRLLDNVEGVAFHSGEAEQEREPRTVSGPWYTTGWRS